MLFLECSFSVTAVCAQSLVHHSEIPVSLVQMEFCQPPVLPLQTAYPCSRCCLPGFGALLPQIRAPGSISSLVSLVPCLSLCHTHFWLHDTTSLDSVIQDAGCFKGVIENPRLLEFSTARTWVCFHVLHISQESSQPYCSPALLAVSLEDLYDISYFHAPPTYSSPYPTRWPPLAP